MVEENFHRRPAAGSLRLFLVRHGETEANRNHLLQGASNGLLNETGQRQVQRLASHLKEIALDCVYASDLQRAFATAQAVAGAHGLEVETDCRLREWNVGELDGLPAAVYLQMIQETGQPLSQFAPPGGERLGQVRQRAQAILEKLIAEHMGEAVLVCSHGDWMRMMVGVLLEIDPDMATAFHFDNASYSVFEFAHDRWRVVALNRTVNGCEPA